MAHGSPIRGGDALKHTHSLELSPVGPEGSAEMEAFVEEWAGRVREQEEKLGLPLFSPRKRETHAPGAVPIRIPLMSPTQEDWASWRTRIEKGWKAGLTHLFLGGEGALQHRESLDLLRHCRELGYRMLTVETSGEPFRHREDVDAFLACVPSQWVLRLWVWGATPEEHDGLTGQEGSFARLEAACNHLRDAGVHNHVEFITSLTRATGPALPAIQRWVGIDRGSLRVHQPSLVRRPIEHMDSRVSISQGEGMTFLMACVPPLGLEEVLPCVRFRHQEMTGEPSLTEGELRENPELLSSQQTRTLGLLGESPTIPSATPCPHTAECALAHLCPGEVESNSNPQFGERECQPVGLWDVLALRPEGEEVDWESLL